MNLDVDSIRQQIIEKKERIQKEYENCEDEKRKVILKKKYANVKRRLKMNELELVRWYHKVLSEQSAISRTRKTKNNPDSHKDRLKTYRKKAEILGQISGSNFSVDDLNTAFKNCETQKTDKICTPDSTEKIEEESKNSDDDGFMTINSNHVRSCY